MMRSLFSAVSGLKNHQTAMDVIGNNVANVNTTAYKASRVMFQDIFSQTISSATAPTLSSGGSNSKQIGLGVTISEIGLNMNEGSTQTTSNTLDLSISGEGFFVVKDASGTYRYTRNGAFLLDSEGYLVTSSGDYVMAISEDYDPTTSIIDDGDPVVSGGNPLFSKIRLSGSTTTAAATYKYEDYAIDSNGVISATVTTTTTAGSSTAVANIGRIVLATFNNPSGLEKAGNSYYQKSLNSGNPQYNFVNDGPAGSVNSGALEMSNVDLANELTNMIVVQRGYQANSRVITTSDSLLEELINLKR
jgi:flagellar hook protein FlgE